MRKAKQRRRFEETTRELGCDQGEALDRVFGKIVGRRSRSLMKRAAAPVLARQQKGEREQRLPVVVNDFEVVPRHILST